MVSTIARNEFDISNRFGGGVHSAASEEDINERECVSGKNFSLDLENREFKSRNGFDKVATAPNGESVRGFVTLRKSDGTVSFLFQAGTNVYSWDGVATYQLVGTVNNGARIRGRFSHYSALDDKVLVTDLALIEQVAEWDGATFQNVTFTDEIDNPFGDFFAKYCVVVNERAMFGHVKDSSATLRHMLVGTKRGDFTNITVTQRPAGTLSAEDPFQITTPDLGAINGMVNAFGVTAVSSEGFSMHRLNGEDATDFVMTELFAQSAAVGDEAISYIGDDIAYGRQGRIESLRATDQYGDVKADDLSRWISEADGVSQWLMVYNRRTQALYAFPSGKSQVYVLFKPLLGSGISPWSVWETNHTLAFQPTAVMSAFDPLDGLEYVFMGDSMGNVYRLEGSNYEDDGYPIQTVRRSPLFVSPLDTHAYDINGWVKYRRDEAASLQIKIIWSGDAPSVSRKTVELKADEGYAVYGGGFYYGSASYGSAVRNRLVRSSFAFPGAGNEFQIETQAEGKFAIAEIGARFSASR